jgi:hypothetical protein
VCRILGRAQEDHLLAGRHEVAGAEMGELLALEAAGVVEVGLLQTLAGREAGGAEAALAAVGLPGGDLALEAGGQELLVVQLSARARPASRARGAQGRRLERPVRNASSAVRPGWPWTSRRPSCDLPVVQAEGGVVVSQTPQLDRCLVRTGDGGRSARSPAAAHRWSGSLMVW